MKIIEWIKQKYNIYQENKQLSQIAQYKKYIDNALKKEYTDIIYNFTIDGYKYIFSTLIFNAQHSVYILTQNYDKIFINNEMFYLFQLRIKNNPELIVKLITYNNDLNDKLLQLQKTYPNFKYYPFSTEKQCNNFIVTDEKNYWIEDAHTKRKEKFLKANLCFRDYLGCAKLIEKFNSIIK